VLAEEWFAMVDAPDKEWITFDGAGHRPHFDQPDRSADVMRNVLTDTLPTENAGS
jgi:pimeloyl-ACP methyl ester carboxylesterase